MTDEEALEDLKTLENEQGLGDGMQAFDAAMHSFDFFGDCIALSPIIFGHPGAFMQSDMQFAQEAIKDMRDFYVYEDDKKDKIKEGISMGILSRFFMKEGTDDEMVASELHVEYGMDLQTELDAFMAAMPIEIQDQVREQPKVKSTVHGNDFGQMYTDEDAKTLTRMVINSVLFDKDDNYAGMIFEQVENGRLVVQSPIDTSNLRKAKNSEVMKKANAHTRIIGFRTTKRCHSAKQILSVQPIYYSINREMCNEVLKPLSAGMMNEINSYGPECAEDARQDLLQLDIQANLEGTLS